MSASAQLREGPVLIFGFGPFLQVRHNPSGVLARAVDGARVCGHTVLGLELPVSYRRAAAIALERARAWEPCLVLATGVASSRSRVEVERYGRPPRGIGALDMDGEEPLPDSGPALHATLPVEGLAQALGGAVSEDAGEYVCNTTYFQLLRGLPGVPLAFVHMPPQGIPPRQLLHALHTLLEPRATP